MGEEYEGLFLLQRPDYKCILRFPTHHVSATRGLPEAAKTRQKPLGAARGPPVCTTAADEKPCLLRESETMRKATCRGNSRACRYSSAAASVPRQRGAPFTVGLRFETPRRFFFLINPCIERAHIVAFTNGSQIGKSYSVRTSFKAL